MSSWEGMKNLWNLAYAHGERTSLLFPQYLRFEEKETLLRAPLLGTRSDSPVRLGRTTACQQ